MRSVNYFCKRHTCMCSNSRKYNGENETKFPCCHLHEVLTRQYRFQESRLIDPIRFTMHEQARADNTILWSRSVQFCTIPLNIRTQLNRNYLLSYYCDRPFDVLLLILITFLFINATRG